MFCQKRLIWRQGYLPVLAVPYPARPVGFLHNFLEFILWSFKKLPWRGLDGCGRQCTHLMWSCCRAVRRKRISGWLNKARKSSVLGKRWRLLLGTHGTLIFPKKNQELVWGKHSGILKYCSDNATTQAFATDILSFGFERTQDARQWRPMYLHGRVVDQLSSPRQWTAGWVIVDTKTLSGRNVPKLLYMYISSKQCTKNWQLVTCMKTSVHMLALCKGWILYIQNLLPRPLSVTHSFLVGPLTHRTFVRSFVSVRFHRRTFVRYF